MDHFAGLDGSLWRSAAASDLHRRALNRAVRAIHATIARLRFQPFATAPAVIEKLASVRWHFLGRLMAALGARNCGFRYDHLAVVLPDDEAGGRFLDRPGRREAAF
jgi:hypothetical protein